MRQSSVWDEGKRKARELFKVGSVSHLGVNLIPGSGVARERVSQSLA